MHIETLNEREATEVSGRHAQMRILAEQAMADPDFVADLQETMQAFQHVDKENWSAYDDALLDPAIRAMS